MEIIKSECVIVRPIEFVWAVFISPSTWPDWYGSEMVRVDPDWQDGALIRWKRGHPSTIVEIRKHSVLKLRHSIGGNAKGNVETWTLAKDPNGTRIKVKVDYSEAEERITEPELAQRDLHNTLWKLKSFTEKPTPDELAKKHAEEEKRNRRMQISVILLGIWIAACALIGYLLLGEFAGAFGFAFVGLWIGAFVRNWLAP